MTTCQRIGPLLLAHARAGLGNWAQILRIDTLLLAPARADRGNWAQVLLRAYGFRDGGRR